MSSVYVAPEYSLVTPDFILIAHNQSNATAAERSGNQTAANRSSILSASDFNFNFPSKISY